MVRLVGPFIKDPMMKTARQSFVRFFPERLLFVDAHLDDREQTAWLRLARVFTSADGVLPCDDKALALVTKTGKRWPDFRDKLIALGLGRIENGHWIDDDQLRNLECQRKARERGTAGAVALWKARRG
jgi:hypothetical protein